MTECRVDGCFGDCETHSPKSAGFTGFSGFSYEGKQVVADKYTPGQIKTPIGLISAATKKYSKYLNAPYNIEITDFKPHQSMMILVAQVIFKYFKFNCIYNNAAEYSMEYYSVPITVDKQVCYWSSNSLHDWICESIKYAILKFESHIGYLVSLMSVEHPDLVKLGLDPILHTKGYGSKLYYPVGSPLKYYDTI